MDQDPVLLRRNRASWRKPVVGSPIDRSPTFSVSSNVSPWFIPGLATLDVEEMELSSAKVLSEDHHSSFRLCRKGPVNLHGADWRSRNWTDHAQFSHDPYHNELDEPKHSPEDAVEDSIEGRISRLRRDAGRMVMEHKLAARHLRQPGWVSDLESITERRRRDAYGSELAIRIRREKVGSRSRRRASYHVMDMQSRRKFARREHHFRREVGTRRNLSSVDIGSDIVSSLQLLGETLHVSKSFSLETLEEYLKERAAARRLQEAEVGALVVAESNPPQLANFTAVKHMEQSRRAARRRAQAITDIVADPQHQSSPISAYESEDAQDEDSDGQRSGCGISWRWLNSHHAKDDSAMPGCLSSVSKRRIGRRLLVSRHRKGGGGWDKYNSEGSFTSFDSDSETVPLMTEPEPFNDYTTDDVAGSPVELERGPHSRLKESKSTKASRFKEDKRSSNGHSFRKSDYEAEGKDLGFPAVWNGRQPVVERHQSLSQKHRPRTFKDLVGQPMVTQSLSNAVLMGKIAPVYLFQGPRGSGKTSAARIFSAALNCLSLEDLRPCGTCAECSSLNAGKNFDVREVDAVSNNGIESMKLLLKHISLPPTSRFKVFIIDECHLLAIEAWNAFLKSLEEPPSYVVFILITTDADQLPRTALSRCQKFLFSKIKDVDVVSRLQKLSLWERIDIDREALQLIASRSDGSLREAEMTLDQISLLGKRATLSTVQEMVGLISEKKLIEFLEVALSPDATSTVKCIRDLMEAGVEPLALISQLATLITDIMAGNNRSAAYRLKHVRRIEDERFRQALKILSEAEKQLRTCTEKTTWLTATFLQFSQPDSSNNLPASSLGTSMTQSPINFFDTSEKETVEGDSHSPHRIEYMENAARGGHRWLASRNFSGPFHGVHKVHSSNRSPRSQADADDIRTAANASRPPSIPRALSVGTSKAERREGSYSMDGIWRKVLDNSSSAVVKQLLCGEAKLVSLSVTEVLATAHLEFRHLEHKVMAERARASIVDAFEEALCCSVDIKITLSADDPREVASGSFEQQSKQRRSIALSKEDRRSYNMDEKASTLEHRSRSSSFRKSSSKFGVVVSSSPRIRLPEPRNRRHSSEVDDATDTMRPSIDLSDRATGNAKFDRAIMSSNHQLESDAMGNGRSSFHYESRLSRTFSRGRSTETQGFRDRHDELDRCSAEHTERDIDNAESFSPTPGNKDMYGAGADKDSSDADVQERYGPSLLCWKGSRVNDGKGKHQRLRRKRKGRLLLRLVPCANGDGRC